MIGFVQRHAAVVTGILNGFDRLRLQGLKRLLAHAGGMMSFLSKQDILLKDFNQYAQSVTQDVRQATETIAQQAGQKIHYLSASHTNKEQVVRRIDVQRGHAPGLICILSCVEPCLTFEIHRNRASKMIDLVVARRKCLHYYHYIRDSQMGMMHLRLQTWFPFTVHVCLNGREWLARALEAEGIAYQRRNNCFPWIEDVERAQALMDDQLRTNWPRLLNKLIRQYHPQDAVIFRRIGVPYYWTVDQSEWAGDVMFRTSADLAQIYPALIRYGMQSLHSPQVLRFLGRKIPTPNGKYGRFNREVTTEYRDRLEGVRIKHRVGNNSVKMYDKEGSVLRVETTINDPRDFKVYRCKEGDAGGEMGWRPLRKSVADLHRRAQVSQAANDRYFEALESAHETVRLGVHTDRLCRPVRWKGQRVRALRPLEGSDHALLMAVSRGEFCINGFRNRDLRELLYTAKRYSKAEVRRQSSRVTRQLRLLRAHHLIRKIPGSHRYVLTKPGRTAISAILAAKQADTASLLDAA